MKLHSLAAIALILLSALAARADYQVEDGTFRFRIDTKAKAASVMKCLKPNSTKELIIPDDILCDDGKTYKVKTIEAYALEGCKLKSIHFPVALSKIEDHAFDDCPNFYKGKDLYIPDGVKTIGMEAFKGCKFSTLHIPSSVTLIGEGAFQASAISSVKFAKPKNGLKIVFRAFRDCKKLTEVALPAGLSELGQAAFAGCPVLVTLSFPSSLKTIPSMVAEDCVALKNVTIPSGVTKIQLQAFAGAGIETLKIPDTVVEIGQNAFSGSSLRSITLSNSLKSLSWCLFSGCANLTAITIPASVTNIESGAFNGCSSLASVHIGAKVASIGQAAFMDCDKLMTVRSDNPTPPECIGIVFGNATLDNADLVIPAASQPVYNTAEVWKDFKWHLKAGIGDIIDDEAGSTTVYFDLSGVRYDQRPSRPGIYIVKQGRESHKIVVE